MLQLIRTVDRRIEEAFNHLPWFLRITIGILVGYLLIWYLSEWFPIVYEFGEEFGRHLYEYFN